MWYNLGSLHTRENCLFLVENSVKSDLCTPCGPFLSAVDELDMTCQISSLFKVLKCYTNIPLTSCFVTNLISSSLLVKKKKMNRCCFCSKALGQGNVLKWTLNTHISTTLKQPPLKKRKTKCGQFFQTSQLLIQSLMVDVDVLEKSGWEML